MDRKCCSTCGGTSELGKLADWALISGVDDSLSIGHATLASDAGVPHPSVLLCRPLRIPSQCTGTFEPSARARLPRSRQHTTCARSAGNLPHLLLPPLSGMAQPSFSSLSLSPFALPIAAFRLSPGLRREVAYPPS